MRRRLVPWLVLVIGLALGGNALAQAKPDFEAAKKHYLAAKDAMGKQDYDTAVQEYLAAYEITKDPSLFKQIAAAYDAKGRKPEAAIYLRRYLSEAKNPPDAAEVKKKIDALEPQVAETPVTAPPPETAPAVPAPETTPPNFLDEGPGWKRTSAWVSVGLAAVLLTTGSVLATSAQSRKQDIQRLVDFRDPATGLPKTFSGTVAQDYTDKADEGDKLNTYAMVAFIGAGVAVGAATVFFILDMKSGRSAPADKEKKTARFVTPYLAPGGGGVVAGWQF